MTRLVRLPTKALNFASSGVTVWWNYTPCSRVHVRNAHYRMWFTLVDIQVNHDTESYNLLVVYDIYFIQFFCSLKGCEWARTSWTMGERGRMPALLDTTFAMVSLARCDHKLVRFSHFSCLVSSFGLVKCESI